MHHGNAQNVPLLKILQEEKFFKNRGETLEIRDKRRRPEQHARIRDERIERFKRLVVVDSWLHL